MTEENLFHDPSSPTGWPRSWTPDLDLGDVNVWRSYSDRDLAGWTTDELDAFAAERHHPDLGDGSYPEVCDRCAALVILADRAAQQAEEEATE